MTILHGNILFSKNSQELCTYENSYLVADQGKIEGIFPVLPEKYQGLEVEEYGDDVIIPAFSDLHVHASQYVERGLGMDMLLYDWLNSYTFPQEARFADMEYAKTVYDAYIDDMIRHGTMHACIYATIHREATSYLVRRMEERGLYGFVGKVNMDMQSPECLCETTEESLRETEQFLCDFQNNRTAKPILTPRFAPTCSQELINGLGKLAKKYQVGLQTHLVESKWEAQESMRVYPGYSCDTEIYERAGLMDHGPVVGAHFIFPSEADVEILNRHGGVAVHCPDATTNIIAGIMGVSSLSRQNVHIALGSDVGGGHCIGVYSQISRAVQLSKLKSFYEGEEHKPLPFAHAFYLATRAGGSIFGNVGSLEKGYLLNALVIENMADKNISLTPAETVERFCYIGNPGNIKARYLNGNKI